MATLAMVLVTAVALLHFYILYLEMFCWTSPKGRRAFGLSEEFAVSTKVLAANQGLYNGFLGAGLLWGLWLGQSGQSVVVFFLLCVLLAGLYGGISANKKILYIQALPSAITLLSIYLL
ncbi:DUF1304 domain-containing protein [Marinomonas sp. TW1]|uniref:DUF1304 domain-containing protein n=1 Tax=Marinomonas sp. TW1 TaxID=1561203 RepID=UPI0007AF07A5|nr:DUF1304 domain-containing protein [Marinomonas sp. TW1]KZN13927.1 membrane protein [Marinomonas sp. TW1]